MIDTNDIVEIISFGIGSFAIGYVAGLALLAFKKAAGVLSR